MISFLLLFRPLLAADVLMCCQETKIYFDLRYSNSDHNVAPQKAYWWNGSVTCKELVDLAYEPSYTTLADQFALLCLDGVEYSVQILQYESGYSNLTLNNYTVLGKTNFDPSSATCFSIAFINKEVVVDCSIEQTPDLYENYFFLQNSRQQNLGFANRSPRKFIVQPNGFVRFGSPYIEIWSNNLRLEKSAQFNVSRPIDLELFRKHLISLENETVAWLRDLETKSEFRHNCSTPPTSFAVFKELIYIACGHLIRVSPSGTDHLENVTATHLTHTENFLIVDSKTVFQAATNQLIFTSDAPLYPLKKGDFAAYFNDTNGDLVIVEILGITLIESKILPEHFVINGTDFYHTPSNLVALNKSRPVLDQEGFAIPQTVYYNALDFVSGANIKLSSNGVLKPNAKWELNGTLQNLTLLDSAQNRNGSTTIYFTDKSSLYFADCTFKVSGDVLTPKCKNKVTSITNITKKIHSAHVAYQGGKLIATYMLENTTITYDNNELDIHLNFTPDYKLEHQETMSVFYNNNSFVAVVSDGRNSDLTVINSTIKIDCLCSDNYQIMITNSTHAILYEYTGRGWQFTDYLPTNLHKTVTFCKRTNGQFLLTDYKQFTLFKGRYIRGTFQWKDEGFRAFGTDNFIYAYNQTLIYQLSTAMDVSIAAGYLRSFKVNNTQNFFALSSGNMDVLVAGDELVAVEAEPMFKPKTSTNSTKYFHPIDVKLAFYSTDSYNRSNYTQYQSTIATFIGNQLQLSPISGQNLLKLSVENSQTTLPVNKLFSGPIANVSLDEKTYYIQGQIYLNQSIEDVVDILQFENSTFQINLKKELLKCQNNKCASVLTFNETCNKLALDKQRLHVICRNVIYSAAVEDNLTFTSTQFNTSQITSIKFSNNLIGAVRPYKSGLNLTIYKDFKEIAHNFSESLVDFEFNDTEVLLLNQKSLQRTNSTLHILSTINILVELSKLNVGAIYQDTVCRQLFKINSTDYVLTTSNTPSYQITLHNGTVKVNYIYTALLEGTPLQVVLNKNILAIVYQQDQTQSALFYSFSGNQSVQPYFQAIQISGKFADRFITPGYDSFYLLNALQGNSTIDQYLVQNQPKLIVTKIGLSMIEIKAKDLNGQVTNTMVELNFQDQQSESKSKWDEIMSDGSVRLSLYIFGFIMVIVGLYLFFVQIRRCFLIRKINFREERPQEFSSEYI